MSNNIASPGVQINEIDLSYNVRTTSNPTVFMAGFAAQGPTYEPIYISSFSEYEQVFGAPTNAAERYLYHSARQITQKTRAQLLVTRLPYETAISVGESDKIFKHSVLMYPASADSYNSTTGKFDFANATEIVLLEPVSVVITQDEYDLFLQNSFDWSQTFNKGPGQLSAVPIGLVVTNDINTSVNNLFEGFYVGIADNSDNDPSNGYNSITGVKVIDGNVITIDTNGFSPDLAVAYGGWNDIASDRLNFKLSQNSLSVSTSDTISEIVVKQGTKGYSFDSVEFNDHITVTLFSLRRSIYETSNSALADVLIEGYAGSLNYNKTSVGPNGGSPRSVYLENVINSPSPYLSTFVNPAISRVDWEDIEDGGGVPTKKIRITNQAKNLYSLGVYSSLNNNDVKSVGYVPSKVERVCRILENPDEYPLDITCDAGLSTIWAGVRCKNVDVMVEETDVTDTSFNDEDPLGYNGTNTPGPDISYLHGKSPTDQAKRDVIVNAHNSIATLYTELASVTRKDHIHITDPLRYIFVEGRNYKKINRKPDTALGAFSFANEIYWPLYHIYEKISTSYVATYPTWFKATDGGLKGDVWIPPSAVVAANIANCTPYQAPAGFTRGVISGLVDTAFSPNQKQRDLLYKQSFNSISVFPGEGIVIFGQKTLLNKPSAFDRLNVRRTFLFLERATNSVMKYFVFEPNNYITRSRVVSTLSPLFDAAKSAGGIYDYKLVCDERNNTPLVLDNNELVTDIYIKPTRTAEFILVNFYATRTNQNFNELVGSL